MEKPPIDAIIFDIGGTLRVNQATGGRDFETVQKLQAFIGDTSEPRALTFRPVLCASTRWN